MTEIWRLAYNLLAVPMLLLYFRLRSLRDEKVREGIEGRRDLFDRLRRQLEVGRRMDRTIWFHFTSVGEFEQAKPVIEDIKDEARIVLTYFSPSVQGNVERYPHKDAASYLPIDTKWNAQRMFDLIEPDLLIFSKFDIWPNLVWEAARRKVPILLIAGTLHAESKRISPIAKPFFSAVHRYIDMHCAISEADARRFESLCGDPSRVLVTGDTRFDQVYRRAMRVDERGLIPNQDRIKRPVVVAGSTYTQSERVLLEAYRKIRAEKSEEHPFTLILVPHEPTEERMREIEELLDEGGLSYVRFSQITEETDLSSFNVLVIDTVGLLAGLYKLGDVAFVGGSFRGNVHNVMEPAVMGKPVIFGPYIANSFEAKVMLRRGGAIMVEDADEMASTISSLIDEPRKRDRIGRIAREVIISNLGAADRTVREVRRFLGVTANA
ncbi:hypothetical protein J7M22_00420 [Candidatus Poribacteria bacterium]|nr:hypothetical protein [Candidatus Poribacteria bacterium]